jgi:AcrR family transcriptional regulator
MAAGVARGTIYSHVPDVDGLFEEVAAQLSHEMVMRVAAGIREQADPALRLSIGVRQYIRRAHDEPLWGRFISRFGLNHSLVSAVQGGDPVVDLLAGIEAGRYSITRAQLPAVVALLVGGTLAAMLPVLDGRGTWRTIGSDTVELMLIGLGLAPDEARRVARCELPPLPQAA